MAAPSGLTKSHPAVMATSPASTPLRVSENDGLPYLIHDVNIVPIPPAAAARLVVRNTCDMAMRLTSPEAASCEPGLNPNHPNHRMNTPKAAAIRLWPGIAWLLPSLPYLPRRGPRAIAPTNANTPPTLCTIAEPAKSWNVAPKVFIMNDPSSPFINHPPPHVQWPEIGYISSEMNTEYIQYIENLVRSAMAPDTMVAAVAQNTVWKIRNPSVGRSLS